MSAVAVVTINNNALKKRQVKKFFFLVLSLFSLYLIIEVIRLSIPDIKMAHQNWPEYFNLTWAYQSNLIQVLINAALMFWLSVSSVFFGGWLLHRSIRILRGKSWSIEVAGRRRKKFFPPVLLYLKLSCYFLVLILLFVVFQYPLQFVFYS